LSGGKIYGGEAEGSCPYGIARPNKSPNFGNWAGICLGIAFGRLARVETVTGGSYRRKVTPVYPVMSNRVRNPPSAGWLIKIGWKAKGD